MFLDHSYFMDFSYLLSSLIVDIYYKLKSFFLLLAFSLSLQSSVHLHFITLLWGYFLNVRNQ